MAINTKKPAMKQTVGAQYTCFANATEAGDYDGTYEADVEKTEVVKSVKVTENSETSDVYASGKIYDSDTPMSSIDIEISVIAFPDDTISKMRGETKGVGGLILRTKFLSIGDKLSARFDNISLLASGKTTIGGASLEVQRDGKGYSGKTGKAVFSDGTYLEYVNGFLVGGNTKEGGF